MGGTAPRNDLNGETARLRLEQNIMGNFKRPVMVAQTMQPK